MGLLDELTAFVTAAKASDLPANDRAILCRHTADIVAARIAGAASSEGKAVASFYCAGQGAESIAGLATLVRLTETDDIHTSTGTTPSSVSVPVALALAAETPCSASELESAIFVATETIVRLGKAAGGAGIFYKGVWPTRAGATLGSAAAACRVWGLCETTTKHALSLAVLLSSGRTGKFEGQPSGRWLVFAFSVAAGIRAAQAARAGFCGDPTILESGGLERALGVPVDAASLVSGLGASSIYSELSLKPYCTSRQALPGAEGMLALIAEGLDPADIQSFTIKAPTAYAGMISQKLDAAVHSSSYVSGAGLAAIAALAPDCLYDVERDGVLHDARIHELARKGSVAADAELDKLYPAHWPAKLEVITKTRKLEQAQIDPAGSPRHPLGDEQLAEKARRILTFVRRQDIFPAWLAATTAPFRTDVAAAELARFFVEGTSA